MNIEQTKDIRTLNRIKIIDLILSKKEYSRAALSKETHLNKATVSTVVKEWMDYGLLTETQPGSSTGGRKPILLEIKANTGFCIAIDFQVKQFRMITCNLSGSIIGETYVPYISDEFLPNLSLLKKQISDTIKNIPPSDFGLTGISICVRGVVDLNGMIRFMPQLNWRNIDVKSLLKDTFQVPVFVDNAGNYAAIAEMEQNPSYQEFVYLSITDVISAGLVTHGKPIRGCHGFANSIGHHTVNSNSPIQCSCGKYGCLEQYCSNLAIYHQMEERTKKQIQSIQEFVSLVKSEDADALYVLNEFIHYLAVGISNLIFFLDCEWIILECELLDSLPQAAEKIIQKVTLPITETQKTILSSSFGADTAIKGARNMCLSNFFHRTASILPGASTQK